MSNIFEPPDLLDEEGEKDQPESKTSQGFLQDRDMLDFYTRVARKHPLLSAEEEQEAIRAWRLNHDQRALKKIIKSHLRLVIKIAGTYQGYSIPINDLISEGHIGLMNALNGYDHLKGARFSTYASWWIKAQMKEFILKSWSLVRTGTTNAQRKLFFNLRRLKKEMIPRLEGSLSPDQLQRIAKELEVSVEDVAEMEIRMSGPDYSLNATIGDDEGSEWQDWMVSETPAHDVLFEESDEFEKRKTLLKKALTILSDTERFVFTARRLSDPGLTLEQLSYELKVSRERVRQIEVKAYQKIEHNIRGIAEKNGMINFC